MANAETGLAVYADLGGVGRQSTGKPDEIETTPVRFGEGVPEKCRATATRRHPTLPYVRFCEGLGVQFPGPTRHLETEPLGPPPQISTLPKRGEREIPGGLPAATDLNGGGRLDS